MFLWYVAYVLEIYLKNLEEQQQTKHKFYRKTEAIKLEKE